MEAMELEDVDERKEGGEPEPRRVLAEEVEALRELVGGGGGGGS